MKLSFFILLAALTPGVLAAQTTMPHRLTPVTVQPVAIHDGFWSPNVTFAPVKKAALRIQARLKPDRSGGICEWGVE